MISAAELTAAVPLSGHGQIEVVEEAERVARLRHVEVLRMDCVRTSIIGETSMFIRGAPRAILQCLHLHPQLQRARLETI